MDNLDRAISDLEKLNDGLFAVGQRLFDLTSGSLGPCDSFALATLRRARHLSEGAIPLLRQRNELAGGALLRCHLDCSIRFVGVARSPDPHRIAHLIFSGVRQNKLQGFNGKPMTDAALVEALDDPWFTDVYARTSGLVHLSRDHIDHLIAACPVQPDGRRLLSLEPAGISSPEWRVVDLGVAFARSAASLIVFVNEWCEKRPNPFDPGAHGYTNV